ncbi:MAG: hypothetical protein WCB27_05180 [Thermoguttaceae bacterium]
MTLGLGRRTLITLNATNKPVKGVRLEIANLSDGPVRTRFEAGRTFPAQGGGFSDDFDVPTYAGSLSNLTGVSGAYDRRYAFVKGDMSNAEMVRRTFAAVVVRDNSVGELESTDPLFLSSARFAAHPPRMTRETTCTVFLRASVVS